MWTTSRPDALATNYLSALKKAGACVRSRIAAKEAEIRQTRESIAGTRKHVREAARLLLRCLPGLLLVAVLGWGSVAAAGWLGETVLDFQKSPVSAIMVAIVLGLSIRTLRELPGVFQPGLALASKRVLRLGIVLLGTRLAILDVVSIGARGIPVVLICVAGALAVALTTGRWLGLPKRLGALIAVGTSICGVSAIIATTSAIDADEHECAYAVGVITVFGLIATIAYPFIAKLLFAGAPLCAGLFLGTSIHDTSQVVAAAQVYSDTFKEASVIEVATVTKMLRNLFMVVLIPGLAYMYRNSRRSSESARRQGTAFPIFVLGFIAMAILRSLGDAGLTGGGAALYVFTREAWQEFLLGTKMLSGYCLVAALAAIGLRTDVRTLRRFGGRPFLVGMLTAVAVGAISYVCIVGIVR